MLFLLKYALKSIRNNKAFSLFFTFSLSLGLIGFIVLESFRYSISASLSAQSRSMSASDISITSRRDLSEKEQDIIQNTLPGKFQVTKVLEYLSMAGYQDKTKLVQVRAISEEYPFYGELTLTTSSHQDREQFFNTPQAWVYPEIAQQLGLSIGDPIKIGDANFTVAGIIKKDSSSNIRNFALSPRVFISLKNIQKYEIVERGSTIRHIYLAKVEGEQNLDSIVSQLDEKLSDPGIRVTSHQQSAENTARFLGYLGDYLGLAGLVALFLSAVGLFYLFQNYFSRNLKNIAILISSGWTSSRAQNFYLVQLVLLSLFAVVPSVLLTSTLLPVIGDFLESSFPIEISLGVRWQSVVFVTVIALLVGPFIGLPILQQLRSLKPSVLFQEFSSLSLVSRKSNLVYFVPLLILFYVLSLWCAQSLYIGSIFFLLFFSALAVLILVSNMVFSYFSTLHFKNVLLNLSLKRISRKRASSIAGFLSISVGVVLLTLIPQLRSLFTYELEMPNGSVLPSLFLFDIQSEQLGELEEYLSSKHVKMDYVSPLVRARLEKINDEAFEKKVEAAFLNTREEQRASFSRNREYNLTYREEPSNTETIIKGKNFSVGDGGLAEISLEERFAQRLGVGIGDRMQFDVQGVPVEGQVSNIRRVRWTSFKPNFFIVFEPNVLEEAPKIFLASVSGLSDEQKNEIQTEVFNKFGNISAIDVGRLVDELLSLMNQMGLALQIMALLSILTGLVVLFSIANQQVRERAWDIALLKVLGSNYSHLKKMIILEFSILGFVAATLGVCVSCALAWILTSLLFDIQYFIDFKLITLVILVVTSISAVVSLLATKKIFKKRPIELLSYQGISM